MDRPSKGPTRLEGNYPSFLQRGCGGARPPCLNVARRPALWPVAQTPDDEIREVT
jgi:hypothetical protein